MTNQDRDRETVDVTAALEALLAVPNPSPWSLTIPGPDELARILAEQQARIDHALCSAPCDIQYPGSDGIRRSTSAEISVDHPQSSYGLPVIIVNLDPVDTTPMDPIDAALLDAMTAPGVHLVAGSRAEELPNGVYGPADLPRGSTIHLHEHREMLELPHGRDITPEETWEQMDGRITRLRDGARRAGYVVVDMFGR